MSAHTVDNVLVENLIDLGQLRTKSATVTASASVYNMTTSTPHMVVFIGSVSGQIVNLQDATTVSAGYRQSIHNNTSQQLSITDGAGNPLLTLQAQERAMCCLQTDGTIAGTWSIEFLSIANNTDLGGAQQQIEDFLFDSYAGAGNNDNQYSFTATTNSGTSDIDGAVAPTSNDYEGMHILSSSNSASARPNVSAFNNINRIAVGAQPERYEMRVRIPTLSDATNTFSVRAGLMDGVLAGQPVNGILWSYTHSVNSGHWTFNTVQASTGTVTDSGVIVVANQWYRLLAVINSLANRVDFYIDDVFVGFSNAHIPNGISQAMRYVFKLEKTVGTTARTANLDYVSWTRTR